MTTTSRRSLLAAALAAPVAAVGVPLATAAPAAAADPLTGCQTVQDWTPVALEPPVTFETGAPLQARIVRIAGTQFLQLRGVALTEFTEDTYLGTLPAAVRPPRLTRGIAARNNHEGISAIRVEVGTDGRLKAFGTKTAAGQPPSTNLVRWIQLDSFSSVIG
ncbi:hypothetical protein [Streptomyces omiyaensis]|uniref:Secreted protein n=1 Tax=Streptomyces omiyaensis TaxID=68247 RepID=A0ABW7BUM9_9ACTN|nr:hypothetical protein [Streptomyces omiyaensis]GGY51865.1 hypothetical protein GCM10010363_36120 [Streptomyces omiyaensis]